MKTALGVAVIVLGVSAFYALLLFMVAVEYHAVTGRWF